MLNMNDQVSHTDCFGVWVYLLQTEALYTAENDHLMKLITIHVPGDLNTRTVTAISNWLSFLSLLYGTWMYT